jgi:hypothetical protein
MEIGGGIKVEDLKHKVAKRLHKLLPANNIYLASVVLLFLIVLRWLVLKFLGDR